ncbi:RING-H2 finger protein ATL3 [Apostasia shenzhenica]|uniref:RING-H2 finger protein ATL3 n=1 Tax=Apostasia shenzhenica TaxID=1088818 RepID=A0A2I0A423_9ASPA|nr:RING-H2 finger protein ATL3 [Apostasia shenzhenica]
MAATPPERKRAMADQHNRFYLLGDNELGDPLALIAHHAVKNATLPFALKGSGVPSCPVPPAHLAARVNRIDRSGGCELDFSRTNASVKGFQCLSDMEELLVDEDLNYLLPNRFKYHDHLHCKSRWGNNRGPARRGANFDRRGRRGDRYQLGGKKSGYLRKSSKHDDLGCRNWRSINDREHTRCDEEPETEEGTVDTNKEILIIASGSEGEDSRYEGMNQEEFEAMKDNRHGCESYDWTLKFFVFSSDGHRQPLCSVSYQELLKLGNVKYIVSWHKPEHHVQRFDYQREMAQIIHKSVALFYRGYPPNCADDFTDDWLIVNVGYHIKDLKLQINSISHTLDDLISNFTRVEDYVKMVMQAELFYSANNEHHHIPIIERERIATFIKKVVERSVHNGQVKRVKFYLKVFVPEEWLTRKRRMKMKICEEDYDERRDECGICLDEFSKGLKVLRTSCGHRFHPQCISRWFETTSTCPICRRADGILGGGGLKGSGRLCGGESDEPLREKKLGGD